jgi:tetratricopeptide (TPR) repeat protein
MIATIFVRRLAGLSGALAASLCLADPAAYDRLSREGQRELQRGHYAEAVRHFEGALRNAEPLGARDARYAAALASLGQACFAQGRYRESESLHRRALAATEKRLPPEHPDVAASLSQLAEVLRYLGKAEEAEPLHRRALRIRESNYGTEHLSVAESLHHLGEVLRAQRRNAEAERFYWRSVMIRSYLQGRDHPSLWPSLTGLAQVNRALGRDAEARQLYERASALAEKALPSAAARPRLGDFVVGDTETLAMSRGNSASLQHMPVSPLSERERLEAAEHPELARQLEGLAEVYAGQGRFAAALELVRRVLTMREGALGAQHPEVGQAYGSLARMLAGAGQHEAALAAARAATRQLSTQSEKRRWQSTFMLHVSLLADRSAGDAAAVAESFATVQHLARLPRTLELAEVQRLMRPSEALVATLATDEAVYVWVVRPGSAVLFREDADERLLPRVAPLLAGAREVLLVPHGLRQALRAAPLSRSYALTLLPAVGSLAERPVPARR